MNRNTLTAIILAAGYSSRMGKFKPLLSLGNTTVLERTVLLFRDVGIEHVLVVVGHRSEVLLPVLEKMGVRWVFNAHYPEGMFTSVAAGVNAMDSAHEAFFLLPVDIPLVRRYTVLTLIEAYSNGAGTILYPCRVGKRGHPPLISAIYAPEIVSWNGDGGLRAFLKQYEQRAANVDVEDENILKDMDTPDQYETLRDACEFHEIPSIRTCVELLAGEFALSQNGIEQRREVTRLALKLGRELNRVGIHMDPELIAVAGLLYGFCPPDPRLRLSESLVTERLGLSGVADAIRMETDSGLPYECPLSIADLISVSHRLLTDQGVLKASTRTGQHASCTEGGTGEDAGVTVLSGDPIRIRHRLENLLHQPLEYIVRVHSTGPLESEIDDLLDEAWPNPQSR